MKTTEFNQSISINFNAHEIFKFFYDLNNHPLIHPYMEKVTEKRRYENEKGQEVTEFEVIDQVRLLGVFFSKTKLDTKRILEEKNASCTFEVRSLPNIKMKIRFSIERTEAGAIVKEEVVIQAPYMLSSYVTREAKKAHYKLLWNLKKHFETQNAIPE